MKPRPTQLFIALAASVVLAGPAFAQEPEEAQAAEAIGPRFGTAHTHKLSFDAASFLPLEGGTTYQWDFTDNMRFRTDSLGQGRFVTSLLLPSGALVTNIASEVCDTTTGASVQTNLYVCSGFPSAVSCNQIPTGSTDPIGNTPMCVTLSGNPNVVINNLNNSYRLEVFLGANNNTTRFRRVVVTYQLQVSPPPGTATFTDVATNHPFFQFIEALFAAGITSGSTCPPASPPSYCPDNPVTRGQMAVFIARALGLHWAN